MFAAKGIRGRSRKLRSWLPSGPATTSPAEGFAAERLTTLAFLEGQSAEAWERPARTGLFGAGLLQAAASSAIMTGSTCQIAAAYLENA
jgi:hypothetical protein